MATASRKKLRMFVPNLSKASSAASSAFSMSLRRFEASLRKRERMPSESRWASLSDRGASLVVASESLGSDSLTSLEGCLMEMERLRLMMSLRPLEAWELAAVYS